MNGGLTVLYFMMFGGSSIHGSFIPATSNYYGYSFINTSSLLVNSIEYTESVVGATAPFSLKAYADVSYVSSRLMSSLPVKPYMHFDYRWELTNSDGSPVYYEGEIINPKTSLVVNPHTDTISPEFTAILREPGLYKLKVTVTAFNYALTQFVVATFTDNIEVSKSSQNHLWYNPLTGNDANDGLDALGIALTSADYVESTGVLTESGKFTTYDHATASEGYYQDRYNFIHISGYGLIEIASKVSNDSVVLKDKLGVDVTGLTSSNGAKQTFDGSAVDNTNIHLLGGQSYDVPVKYDIAGVSGECAISSYGVGKVIYTSATLPVLADFGVAGASESSPAKISLHNITFDCNKTSGFAYGGFYSNHTDVVSVIHDRVDVTNSILELMYQPETWTTPVQFTFWKLDLYNKRVINDTYTITSAASGASTIIVSEAILATTPSSGVMRVGVSGAFYEYSSVNAGTKTFTLTSPLTETYTGSAIASENKSMCIFSSSKNTGTTFRSVGCTLETDSDSQLLDHYWYADGNDKHYHVGWLKTQNGDRPSFALNINCRKADVSLTPTLKDFISVHDLSLQDCDFAIDFGNHNNNSSVNMIDNVYISRVWAKPDGWCISNVCAMNIFICDTEYAMAIPSTVPRFMLEHSGLEADYDPTRFDYVMERNKSFGGGVDKNLNSCTREVIGNNIWVNYGNASWWLDAQALRHDETTWGSASIIYAGNNFYAPDSVSGTQFYMSGGLKSLAEFNVIAGHTNTETLPDWTDPSNGNFTPAPVIQTLNFNGIDSYASFSEVVLITDFECEFVFSRPTVGAISTALMARTLTDNTAKVFINNTGEIGFKNQSAQQVLSVGALMNTIDQEYFVRAVCVAGVLEIFTGEVVEAGVTPTLVSRGSGAFIYNFRTSVIGAGANAFASCAIKNLKFTDRVPEIPESVSWGIDSGFGDGETESPDVDTLGIGDMTGYGTTGLWT